MEIHRTVDGKTYSFALSPEELRMAYNEMENTYMRLDIDSMLEKTETITFKGKDIQSSESLSTELFKGSQRFYNDIIFRKEKMDSHVDDFQYAMEDVLSENGSDYIKLIIEEKFADKDLFFLDPSGDIRWVTYNPDSSAGGQFIDITFSQNMLKEAYASEEKIDEYILSRCNASLIDANKEGFIDYANCIAQRTPDWNDFDSVINDIIKTKKEGKSMTNENISKLNNDNSSSYEGYTIRADKDPFGASVYFGYKDDKQYTDAEDTIYELLEHNPEYAKMEVIENSSKRGYISDSDYVDAALIVMTAAEKEAHIEAVEMAMDWNDTHEPAVPKTDYLLYEQLVQERHINSADTEFRDVRASELPHKADSILFATTNIPDEIRNKAKKALIVNLYGGPGAGKSTTALQLVAELKKRGLHAEYVSEVAKDLVYAKAFDILDGSLENQKKILTEQKNRLDMIAGNVDVAVTDSPLLLNTVYLKEQNEEHLSNILSQYNEYNNFNILISRDTSVPFENEGRIHNLEKSMEKDREILSLLESNNIDFERFDRDNIGRIAEEVTQSLVALSNQEKQTVEPKILEREIDSYNLNKELEKDDLSEVKKNISLSLFDYVGELKHIDGRVNNDNVSIHLTDITNDSIVEFYQVNEHSAIGYYFDCDMIMVLEHPRTDGSYVDCLCVKEFDSISEAENYAKEFEEHLSEEKSEKDEIRDMVSEISSKTSDPKQREQLLTKRFEKDINNDRDSLENLHGAFKLFDEAGKGRWDMGNWGISDGAYDLWFEIYHENIPVIDCVSGELNIVNDTHEPELVGMAFDKILEICPDLYDGRNSSSRGR